MAPCYWPTRRLYKLTRTSFWNIIRSYLYFRNFICLDQLHQKSGPLRYHLCTCKMSWSSSPAAQIKQFIGFTVYRKPWVHQIKSKQAIFSVFGSSNVYITCKLSSQVPECLCKSKILTSGFEINFLFDAGLSSFAWTQSARALGGCFFHQYASDWIECPTSNGFKKVQATIKGWYADF